MSFLIAVVLATLAAGGAGPEIGSALQAKVEERKTCRFVISTYSEKEDDGPWRVVAVDREPRKRPCGGPS